MPGGKMEEWVTFGLEAYGSDEKDQIEEILRETLKFFIQQYRVDGLRLKAEDSYGYPKWLSQLVAS
jgi:1,4-alpha-glucan branching enzyme